MDIELYETLGLRLVKEPYTHEGQEIPSQIKEKVEELYYRVRKGKRSDVKVLKRLIGKYPNVPILKNFLFTLYEVLDKKDAALRITQQTVDAHPLYLSGRLSLAKLFYTKENTIQFLIC